tara:strand:- start:578 stop:877 length:300 start_codon:yes stop_codon:yes gene_type:complete
MLRKPDSIPANDTIIQDPSMEPFFISKSTTGGFTVYERVVKGENKTPYIKTICYPANFPYALKVVAEEKLHESKSYDSIKNYVDTYKSISERMTNSVSL